MERCGAVQLGEYEVCSAQEWGPLLKPELGNGTFGWHGSFPRKGEMLCVPKSFRAAPQHAEAQRAGHRGAGTPPARPKNVSQGGISPPCRVSPPPQGLSSPLLRCPSQRLLDRIVRRYAEVPDAGSIYMDHLTDRDKLRLLYTLALNSHPILLQVRATLPQLEHFGFSFLVFQIRCCLGVWF